MKIDIITIFPNLFTPFLNESLIKLAQTKGLIEIVIHDLRDFTTDRHHKVDDEPYGGGQGMVMKPEPIFKAVTSILNRSENEMRAEDLKRRIILLSPQGKSFNQGKAEQLVKESHLIFICGRYEGTDERVRKHLVTDEISIGDYVLMGGELPALVVVEAVARLIPGVVGDKRSVEEESFTSGYLDYPQYTRPQTYKKWSVPKVLLSGDHKKIERWRKKEAIKNTLAKRPDLLLNAQLSEEEKKIRREIRKESS